MDKHMTTECTTLFSVASHGKSIRIGTTENNKTPLLILCHLTAYFLSLWAVNLS